MAILKVGPKRRRYDAPKTSHPSSDDWLAFLQAEGKEGGCLATKVCWRPCAQMPWSTLLNPKLTSKQPWPDMTCMTCFVHCPTHHCAELCLSGPYQWKFGGSLLFLMFSCIAGIMGLVLMRSCELHISMNACLLRCFPSESMLSSGLSGLSAKQPRLTNITVKVDVLVCRPSMCLSHLGSCMPRCSGTAATLAVNAIGRQPNWLGIPLAAPHSAPLSESMFLAWDQRYHKRHFRLSFNAHQQTPGLLKILTFSILFWRQQCVQRQNGGDCWLIQWGEHKPAAWFKRCSRTRVKRIPCVP